MSHGNVRETSLCQQTVALLWKNVLLKWRRKWHTVLEWLQNLAFVLLMFFVTFLGLSASIHVKDISPAKVLGRLDEVNITNFTIGYVTKFPTTRDIMQNLKTNIVMQDIMFQEYADEDLLLEAITPDPVAGVTFEDKLSYHIKFHEFNAIHANDYFAYMGYCGNGLSHCYPTQYWSTGFLSLQASIDAAIIELTTNHSVWETMASIVTIKMASKEHTERANLQVILFIFAIAMCYVSLTYLLSLYVTRDRDEMREIMKMMRLKDLAFWLSWGLLYSGYVLILANLMTLVTQQSVFLQSSYGVIMMLFFLYGLAMICVTFMLSAVFRNPRVTAIAGFFITLFLSGLGLMVSMRNLPKTIEVLLSIFPPFAFSVGITQSVHMELNSQGVYFMDMMDDSSHMLISFTTLVLDCIFYMTMALYFDKVLADKNGMKYEPFFFLKSSYWSREKMAPISAENEENSDSSLGDFVEKVPSELHGKRAIRVKKVKKTYNDGNRKVEALRGLDLDIYEGQITALLGHSGAGKTTLLNILSGMCPATGGTSTVYNYKLSDMDHLEEIRKRAGFCPQFDVKFDPLTVKENLKVFAKIKGIPSKEVEEEVQNILEDLQMNAIANVEASKLSGGQRRKLTLGIAVLGNPQVVLLDEPTAGLDPCSRHTVWAMLKKNKADRVTLLSTQFMDEADILADRKAVISSGRLKCVGASMFLKRKWGIGYHLRMQMSPPYDPEVITSIIKQHISSANLTAKNEEEITYTLPFEKMSAFPDLFSHLDGHVGQDIVSYGVSMTTLDDVFLKLEGEAEIEKGDYGVFSQERGVEEEGDYLPVEMDESLLLMSDSGNVTISGWALWRQQVLAVAKTRFLKLRHDAKSFRAILLLLVLFLIPLILIVVLKNIFQTIHSWELTPSLYFQQPGDRIHRYYSKILVNNNTGLPIEDFVDAVKAQDIVVDVVNGIFNFSTTAYKGAIEVSQGEKAYNFRIIGNPQAQNALPVLLNVISNALLKTFKSKEHIRVWNTPTFNELPEYAHKVIYLLCLHFMVLASGLTPHFAMSSIEDNRIKARTQLRLSGLFSSAYWIGQALVDIVLNWFLLFLMLIITTVFNYNAYLEFWMVARLIIILIGYGAEMVLYVYIISFIFRRGKRHHDSLAFFFVMTAFFAAGCFMFFLFFSMSFLVLFGITIILPSSTLSILLFHTHYQAVRGLFADDTDSDAVILLIPYIHIVLFYGVLWCLEWKFGIGSMKRDPVFRTLRRRAEPKRNPEELEGADDDVLAERERVKTSKAIKSKEKPVIIVDSLRKEYKVNKRRFVFNKKKKAATKNISFCVKQGEVLGLLGPNGAGKSTSIYMLAGEVKPTAGEVVLSQYTENTSGFLGYCPQDSMLWPNLTVQQHLEIYSAIKGMKKEDACTAIKRVAEALELKEHLEKQAGKLSAGVSRKVCFAISMLGNPTIVLLDEPSTGLDPKGQQRLWRAIRAAFKNRERGAILTTHYMEEAEAVCDRVAIMVSGKLRCIGSIQQLKSKFGKGYLLEIKVKDSQQVDVIHNEIIRLFPQATKQDRFSSLLSYKIPRDNVKSLSHAFLHLEEAKSAFNIEEYSFSQPTLEQVFIELTKEQDNEDYDLDSKFQWKHLRSEKM
ncbi:ABC-type organic anion transporter ABCA8-like isoform 2-T2 [Discoglossus pictus]